MEGNGGGACCDRPRQNRRDDGRGGGMPHRDDNDPGTLALPHGGGDGGGCCCLRRLGVGGRRRRALSLVLLASLVAAHAALYRYISEAFAAVRTRTSSGSGSVPHRGEGRREAAGDLAPPLNMGISGACRLLLPSIAARRSQDEGDDDEQQQQYHFHRLPYAAVWNRLRPAVRNATVSHPERFANHTLYRQWVSALFRFYTYGRLRKSRAHPAPQGAMQKLLEVVSRRLDDPSRNGPLRIVVMGGSVTAGRGCDVNPLDLPDTNHPMEAHRWCAYPQRLQTLLNQVLFPHLSEEDRALRPVFEVVNMAVQATNSQVGAVAMEHQLVPSLIRDPPHVVVSSYSANDAKDPSESDTFRIHQQDWIRAARNLRQCDDDLPLVVVSDDWYTHPGAFLEGSLANTGSLYKAASWHNLMAIMYSNVVRTAAIENSNFSSAHPLFGSRRQDGSHLGVGFHVAQGWTWFFNLLGELHDACALHEYTQHDPPQGSGDDSSDSASSNTSILGELARELPTKYVGRYDDSGHNVLREWDANLRRKGASCAPGGDEADAARIGRNASGGADRPYATPSCEYAWMVNPMTPIKRGKNVEDAMDHVLVRQAGWHALYRLPKTGWFTNVTAHVDGDAATTAAANLTALSHFVVELRNLTASVDTFTLLSLKSYGPGWVGSKLQVEIRVIPGPDWADEGSHREPPPPLVVQVDGFHDRNISVTYAHKFRLPSNRAGDAIRAAFALSGGTAFMISGMAFCRSLTAL